MKKAYVKPEVAVESFVLSQNIAACGGYNTRGNQMTNHYGGGSCELNLFGDIYFLESNGNCLEKIAPGESDAFCYQAPTADMAPFGS